MFQYEKTVTGKINTQKLWELYSDVARWKEWDVDVETVRLDGAFAPGGRGVMTMKHGQSLPFAVESASVGEEFTVSAHLGAITVSFIHTVTETTITHAVTVAGGEERQMEDIGKGITANLPVSLERLLSMVSQ